MNKPLWSVVCIARNEEETLPRLVASLREFQEKGGEIVIMDTGSSDKTAQIARDLGCKVTEVGDRFRITIDEDYAKRINERFLVGSEEPIVVSGDSLFDFASARNYAATLASNNLISMPDCDEVFTKLDIDEVNRVIESGVEQLEYNFVFSHDQYGNEAIKFLHSKFYDRRKLSWVGVVHEVLSGNAVRHFLPESQIKLEHYQNEKTNRSGYLKGLALDCYEHPENDRNSHYLGRELLWTSRPLSALRELERHVDMEKWPTERSQSMIFMGDAFLALNRESQAVTCWNEAYAIESGRREPFIRLAEFYFRKDDHRRTAAYASASLTIPQGNFYADNSAHYQHVPHELLAWAFWYLGDKEKSKEHFDKAFAFQPLNGKFLYDYRFHYPLPQISVVLPHLSLGNPEREEGLKKCCESINNQNYPKELIRTFVIDGEGTVPEKVKKGVEELWGEYIVYAANDMEFHPDAFILAYIASRTHSKALAAFAGGDVLPDDGNICEHFMIRRDFIPALGGEVFDTEFHHVGVDNLLWAKAKKLGEAIRVPEAHFVHRHFSHGFPMDAVYNKGWERAARDRELLTRKLKEL